MKMSFPRTSAFDRPTPRSAPIKLPDDLRRTSTRETVTIPADEFREVVYDLQELRESVYNQRQNFGTRRGGVLDEGFNDLIDRLSSYFKG